MIYARFSDDGWKCDACVFRVNGGPYTVDVASYFYPHPETIARAMDRTNRTWKDALLDQAHELSRAERKPIGGKFDGERFVFNNPAMVVKFIGLLREAGYRVPEACVKALERETY